MSTRLAFRSGFVLATAVVFTACVQASASRRTVTPPVAANGDVAAAELYLDAELGARSCSGLIGATGVSGYARVQVRDASDDSGASELEYELYIENEQRLRLSGAALHMTGIANGPSGTLDHSVVLWAGETSEKPRLRMRGIVALPHGASTADFAAALRERRGGLQVRISDQSGAPAGCGELRN